MNVTVADPFGQTVALLEIATVGSGTTVIVTEPVSGCVQLGVPEAVTLTKVITVVDV